MQGHYRTAQSAATINISDITSDLVIARVNPIRFCPFAYSISDARGIIFRSVIYMFKLV